MKRFKPTSKSRRHMTVVTYKGVITTNEPHKALTSGFKRDVGRNNRGRVTTRHKGGGNKKLFRMVDFNYDKKEIPAKVLTVEYDPNRTSFISLVQYKDGEKRYVLVPQTVRPGDMVIASLKAEIKPGNRLPLSNIPVGTFIYNVEIKPNAGAKLVRAAGNFAEVVAQDNGYTLIKMPSTEVRKVLDTCWASIGTLTNEENRLQNYGKAGKSRWKGIRPTVRGTAMNPVDHPHGGGEGRQGRGRRRAISVYGKPTGKGQKSRRQNKYSNPHIVSRRKVGKKG